MIMMTNDDDADNEDDENNDIEEDNDFVMIMMK